MNVSVCEVGTSIKITFSSLSYCTPFASFQRFEQSLNAEDPMEVTLEGIFTEVKPEQPEKAEAPMEVTLEGIVIDVKREQL